MKCPECFYTCLCCINPYVCVFRMKKKSGVGSRRTSRQPWWWPTTSRWRLSRSCVLSGDSCRRSRIAAPSSPQTWRPCRVSGTSSIIMHFFQFLPLHRPLNPSGIPLFSIGLQLLSLSTQRGYEIPARVLPNPHPLFRNI